MKINKYKSALIYLLAVIMIYACEDYVERGGRPDYVESSAQLYVSAVSTALRSVDDTIWYTIETFSETNIRSLIITASEPGSGNTGFVIPNGETDPFTDHRFGIIRDGTNQFKVNYMYIIPETTSDVIMEFKLIDGEGEKIVQHIIEVVPSIVRYDSLLLYTESGMNTDGFSSFGGIIYHDLLQYEAVTEANQDIQESIDVIFLVDRVTSEAMLIAPGNSLFQSDFTSKNNTVFIKSNHITSENFDSLTNGTLVDLTKPDSLATYGTNHIKNIKVGDIVAFQTDYNAKNSFKTGVLKINAIHPSSCDWYDGEVYMLEMDVVTQITE